jgi:hypothetical protein
MQWLFPPLTVVLFMLQGTLRRGEPAEWSEHVVGQDTRNIDMEALACAVPVKRESFAWTLAIPGIQEPAKGALLTDASGRAALDLSAHRQWIESHVDVAKHVKITITSPGGDQEYTANILTQRLLAMARAQHPSHQQ